MCVIADCAGLIPNVLGRFEGYNGDDVIANWGRHVPKTEAYPAFHAAVLLATGYQLAKKVSPTVVSDFDRRLNVHELPTCQGHCQPLDVVLRSRFASKRPLSKCHREHMRVITVVPEIFRALVAERQQVGAPAVPTKTATEFQVLKAQMEIYLNFSAPPT